MVMRVLCGEYRRPYSEFPAIKLDLDILLSVLKSNLRPSFHDKTPECIKKLICRCWDIDRDSRPTVSHIINELHQIEEIYRTNQQEWDSYVPKMKAVENE
eukprot:TRINITY_DN12483_c0_g1_i1.p1 TRINITY_DN12483_c0_g1~~TRINITY_DN12483_c0_g1_i1.p1  ORF type:complete len:100 (-),score=13.09 TRINITY_DN12483_c0_g1_i1:4-303(-)